MAFADLLLEDVNGVRWITLNRPAKLNALTRALLAELGGALSEALADPAVRVVAIMGSGEKAFAAGADIGEFAGLSPREGEAMARAGQAVFDGISASAKPVIAAVNGFALGGGCELALACHVRVASSSARFGQPEVKLGLIPGYGGTQRLARLVGQGRALELLLGGAMIDAPTALGWGLVNRVVEPAALREATQRLAEEIGSMAPLAVARCLQSVRVGLGMPLDKAMEVEAALFGLCFATDDMREGTAAFLEKRPPRFAGR
ncbi:MAG TPA: enoyl-CoA hydratase-related protein [Thermoanaerobaculaceae bacterium]|nr:enoyl-CoA hydratase-related protein [Thermoanaerobaculaceae bacterium]